MDIRSVQLLSRVRLFATPWIAACQASLSITNSRSSLRLTSIESVMPSSHLILLSPSLPALNPSQHLGLFKWVSASHQVAKVLELHLQHQFTFPSTVRRLPFNDDIFKIISCLVISTIWHTIPPWQSTFSNLIKKWSVRDSVIDHLRLIFLIEDIINSMVPVQGETHNKYFVKEMR